MDKVVKNFSEYSEFNKSIDLLNNIRDIFLDIEDDGYACNYEFHQVKGTYKIGKSEYNILTVFGLEGDKLGEITENFNLKNQWMVSINGSILSTKSLKIINESSKCIERIQNAYDLEIEDMSSYYYSIDNDELFYFKKPINKSNRRPMNKKGKIDFNIKIYFTT